MAICKNCGTENSDGVKFCISCGTPFQTVEQPVETPAEQPANDRPYQEPVYDQAPNQNNQNYQYGQYNQGWQAPPQAQPYPQYAPPVQEPEKEKGAVSVGKFIGIFLLMCIPLVGLIFMIVWACGGTKNRTIVNFARAYLILCAIALVIAIVLSIVLISFITTHFGDLAQFFRDLFEGRITISF